jgi:hypothetical protein
LPLLSQPHRHFQTQIVPSFHSLCLSRYPSSHKGYRCFDLTTKRIIISRHVVFDETQFPFSTNPPSVLPSSLDFLITGPTAPVPRTTATPSPADTAQQQHRPIWRTLLRIRPFYILALHLYGFTLGGVPALMHRPLRQPLHHLLHRLWSRRLLFLYSRPLLQLWRLPRLLRRLLHRAGL